MEMLEIDGKEMRMIEFIEKKIRKIIRVCSANGSSIEGIVRENGFFYSEDDFQISLVREFEKYYPGIKVFYELNWIDIVLKLNEKEEYPIELKYSYDEYGADDKNDISVGFAKDINKINDIVSNSENVDYGYCVLLIKKNTEYTKTDLEEKLKSLKGKLDNSTFGGNIEWTEIIKKETVKKELHIENLFPIKYDTIENFHYLIIEISKQNTEKIISK